jgi:hypothetical protein
MAIARSELHFAKAFVNKFRRSIEVHGIRKRVAKEEPILIDRRNTREFSN